MIVYIVTGKAVSATHVYVFAISKLATPLQTEKGIRNLGFLQEDEVKDITTQAVWDELTALVTALEIDLA